MSGANMELGNDAAWRQAQHLENLAECAMAIFKPGTLLAC